MEGLGVVRAGGSPPFLAQGSAPRGAATQRRGPSGFVARVFVPVCASRDGVSLDKCKKSPQNGQEEPKKSPKSDNLLKGDREI